VLDAIVEGSSCDCKASLLRWSSFSVTKMLKLEFNL